MRRIVEVQTTNGLDTLKELREDGWDIYRVNWPEFICKTREGKVVFMDVRRQGKRTSTQRERAYSILSRLGFEVMRVTVKMKGQLKRIDERPPRTKLPPRPKKETEEGVRDKVLAFFTEMGEQQEVEKE